jgi:hypothetical protein
MAVFLGLFEGNTFILKERKKKEGRKERKKERKKKEDFPWC